MRYRSSFEEFGVGGGDIIGFVSGQKKSSKQRVVIDAVISEKDDGRVSAIVPASVGSNTILIGKELAFHPVKKLCYQYNAPTFVKISQDFRLNETECELLKQLIDLNSGYITPKLLTIHFKFNYHYSDALVKSLAKNKQACIAPEDRELYLLPYDKIKDIDHSSYCTVCGHLESKCSFDEVIRRAVELIQYKRGVSAALLQQDLKISYSKADEVLDILEREGLVGPADGANPRTINDRIYKIKAD